MLALVCESISPISGSWAGDYPGVCLLIAGSCGDPWSPGDPGAWRDGVTKCHSSLRCSLTLLRRHSSAQIRVSCYNLDLARPGLAIPSLITLGLIFLGARVYVYDAQ